MAIIVPANQAPDTRLRVRGLILTRNWRGLWIVAAWPRKRGPPTTWRQYWTVQQFSYAGKMAANAEPISYETARFLTQDSDWLPRDVLTMVAVGKFYEVYLPDGTLAPRADHSPPPEPIPPRSPVISWQPNAVNGVLAGTPSASAFAFKGEGFIPDVAMDLTAVSAVFTPVNGASYRAVVATMNGSNVVTALNAGTLRTISGTVRKLYEFQITQTLSPGSRYAIMVGRTDGTNTYVFPLATVTGTQFLIPCQAIGATRLPFNTPAIGQTVDVTTTGACLSLLLNF
jgi:hypothetical protein